MAILFSGTPPKIIGELACGPLETKEVVLGPISRVLGINLKEGDIFYLSESSLIDSTKLKVLSVPDYSGMIRCEVLGKFKP